MKLGFASLALLAFAAFPLGACRRERPVPEAARRAEDAATDASDRAPSAPLPSSSSPSSSSASRTHLTYRASFPLRDVTLRIADLHMSKRLDDVLTKSAAAVVVNGGFFGEDGEPVGLAVSEGRPLGRFSPQMSGGVLWVRDDVGHLSATEDYRETAVDFAVQCRPRLVVASRVNIRSDDGRRAARTALCLRDGGRTIELATARGDHGDAGPTLFELAGELLAEGCEDALNLDGGPSTAWAAAAGADGGVVFSPPVAPVRHAVVVRRK
jgi:uncharacterized protein YigE (DUF2233 family)